MGQLNAKVTLEVAKQVLTDRGYTYRQAAPLLGVTYQHLSEVLNGHRQSASLLRRISDLPSRETKVEAAPAVSEGAR